MGARPGFAAARSGRGARNVERAQSEMDGAGGFIGLGYPCSIPKTGEDAHGEKAEHEAEKQNTIDDGQNAQKFPHVFSNFRRGDLSFVDFPQL